nr:hypothetical protein [Chitinophagaceae bacterium]
MKVFHSLFILCFCWSINSQAQTSASQRLSSLDTLRQQVSPFDGIKFRNIGPSIMSGRVTDIEVNPTNPNEFYVAYASGGVWHSTNNGQSMQPIFDHESSMTIGDMAMDWKSGHLWVGTGEVNSSRSSYAGTGIYMTSDTGKTWQYKGLPESHHIGRVVVHPKNPNIIWVAVLGHLYTKNQERGVYKSEDGGLTWLQQLSVNDSTGCSDLVPDPSNPDVLYACMWTRTRTAWNFNGSGEGSAIYKTNDGGTHWEKITTGTNGFPQGKGVGRIGVAICQQQPKILYAVLDNQSTQEKKTDEHKKLKATDIEKMNEATFLQLDDSKLESYLRDNGYPEKYTASQVKQSIREKKYQVIDVANWLLGDADRNLFNTEVIGAEVYKSIDAGNTWIKTHAEILEGVVFTYGYYFATIAVSPVNPSKVYIAGYPLIGSEDSGKTFKQLDGDNCHPDYHRIWINPSNDQHMIVGNDGGVNITYDGGAHWFKANNPAVGQFYAVQVDEATPYNVYGGLQDNGTWMAPSTTVENTAWHQSGQNPYKNIGDGDGMQVMVDTRDNKTSYVGYQFGNYFRVNTEKNEYEAIQVTNDIGQPSLRFNWQTPILLSKHQQDIFYLGSNKVHRSLQQGKKMETLSSDLTASKHKGNVPYATLTTLAESPLRFGLLYTGSDDGLIHCSKDGGYTWTKISQSLPTAQGYWVTRVVPSKYKESRVYVAMNGYRNDDFTAYVFASEDYGKTWKQIGLNLPQEPVNVLREDPKDEQILYVGTDNGLYVSMDRQHFMTWRGDLPRVAVHDIAIQERENEMVLGTHGRSIYISKLNLVQWYRQVGRQQLAIHNIDSVEFNAALGKKDAIYATPRSLEIPIAFYAPKKGNVRFEVFNDKNKLVYSKSIDANFGMNQAT